MSHPLNFRRRAMILFLLAAGVLQRPIQAATADAGEQTTIAQLASAVLPAPPVDSHDLPLPAWGPFSKKYPGCSHIPNLSDGRRFDFSVFPGLFRGPMEVPNVSWASGFAPWRAAPDGSAWEYRYDLRGLDQLFVTVRYVILSPERVRVRIACSNRSDVSETFSLDLIAGMQYPLMSSSQGQPQPMVPVKVTADSWLDARNYSKRISKPNDPLDRLQPDGRGWHEIRESGMVDFGGLSLGAGDFATWKVPIGGTGVRWGRLRAWQGDTKILVDGAEVIVPRGDWQTLPLPGKGSEFTIVNAGVHRVDCNGFAFGPAPKFQQRRLDPVPRITFPNERVASWLRRKAYDTNPRGDIERDAVTLSYPDLGDASYHLAWDLPKARLREWKSESLDMLMPAKRNNHVLSEFEGPGVGHWTDIMLDPIPVPAKGEKVIEVMLSRGADIGRVQPSDEDGETRLWTDPDLGQQMLAATLLTNVVYPIYTRRQNVRHYTPGKIWDSLYTWDCGFIGLGLLELNQDRAFSVLQQYLMPEDDPDCAYLQHGSPVPVQLHLAQNWWNRTRDLERLRQVFPGLRQMHRFLVGRYGGSDTDRMRTGLLQTWSLFYNSGGWDDYPAQFNKANTQTTPVVTSSQLIRTAKILRYFANLLGEDGREFDSDVVRLTGAIQSYAWDPAEGWFSYVVHDATGKPTGFLRHETGTNYNRGLDGLTPLMAGICTKEQEQRLLEHLDRDLMTPVGVSTVDIHAPYYSTEGYWNGSVWMPHQWFLWRALLDLGESDRAWQIADTALRVWRDDVERTHQTREMFSIVSGRGAGWVQFGGLSSPVLSWHAAYSAAGRITGGYDLWIENETMAMNSVQARLRLTGRPGRTSTVLVVLPGTSATATWNGQPVPAHRRERAIEVTLPADGAGELVVTAKSASIPILP